MTEPRNLISYIRRTVGSLPAAKKALALLGKELNSAKTYREIRQIEQAAAALKILFGEVDVIKHEAELLILDARARIGTELKDVPKAKGGGQLGKSGFTAIGKSTSGKAATGIPGTSRARLQKLAALAKEVRDAIARQLQAAGKDATTEAVLRIHKEGEIKQERTTFEARRDRGARVADLQALAAAGKKFKVIVADPPWEFKVYSGKGKQRSAERHYDVSSIEKIKEFGRYIEPLMDDDCAVLMWCVWPELPGALDVLKAWNVVFKTLGFLWVKATSSAETIALDGNGLHWGMGYWSRANTEGVLLATRGAPKRMAKDIHQLVISPAEEHSAKPDEVYRRIEKLLVGPYLELFARQSRAGWTVWGNEIAATREAAE